MAATAAPPPNDQRSAPVVVGIDGSRQSDQALSWAAQHARLSGSRLEIVHSRFLRKEASDLVRGVEAEETDMLDRAITMAKELEPAVEVSGRIVDPPAAEGLIEASRGAALLVVGCRGVGAVEELTLGSVSHQCARHAHCPVVIVRPRS
jgi:nucleotide-binding universal stress UspA family protein